jgi:hypothetical protein
MRTPGWPAGYTLEAALDLAPGQEFTPTAGLSERLRPMPFLSVINRLYNHSLQVHTFNRADLEELNLKHFALHIPVDLAGHTLTLRARYTGNGASLTSGITGPIKLIAPCDQNDRARIESIRLFEAWLSGDNERTLEIADSMLTNGLSDAQGWVTAQSAAWSLNRPDKVLNYLERMYEDFRQLTVELGTATPPRFNPQMPPDPKIQQEYEHRRSNLLEAITRQQQQR